VNFASDNTAGVPPEMIQALIDANHGFVLGYGNDDWTRRLDDRMNALFGRDVATFLVPTGTAANALALAHITPPWGGVICHQSAHIMTDECGAPEFFGGGIKLIGFPGDDGKLSLATLKQAISQYSARRPHQVNAAALSLTQASESGTIYRPAEIAALCETAHAAGLKVHMDGARFGNALSRLNASAADLTWKAGVDVLSFGATKGGAMAAEAIVFFDPKLAEWMPERRKRGGQLLSKHRFIAAQFEAYLEQDRWLAWARHANQMADRLARRLGEAGIEVVWPVEANLVFAIFPKEIDARLKAAGAAYYARRPSMLPPGVKLPAEAVLARMVTSFATTPEEIERFGDLIQKR
jgi:threonine aldolase